MMTIRPLLRHSVPSSVRLPVRPLFRPVLVLQCVNKLICRRLRDLSGMVFVDRESVPLFLLSI